ncbi:MAG: DNA repair protein RecO [Chlamydiae bacterium]|nr:DNA repair protein RecO [Chlamydiota bacterium]
MPSEEKHEGLVLRSLDYKDRQKIITLFTPTCGIISLIVKGITRKKTHLLTLTSPFTQAEYHFSIRRSDLYTFRDGTLLNTHHTLRQSLSTIEGASVLAKALLTSQLPGKPAPALYRLTLTYLKHLPAFTDPTSLTTSFHLKLLKHDGHLTPDNPESPFTPQEWALVTTLTETRSIDTLMEMSVPLDLSQKVQLMFKEKI